MSEQGFHIEIDEDGDVVMEGKGFKGPECEELGRDIAKALGRITKAKKKPEYHLLKAAGRKVAR